MPGVWELDFMLVILVYALKEPLGLGRWKIHKINTLTFADSVEKVNGLMWKLERGIPEVTVQELIYPYGQRWHEWHLVVQRFIKTE